MDALGLTSPQKKLVMWYKVKELKSNGLNYVQIAHEIGLHRQTVMKYDKMTLEAFQSSQTYKREFNRKLGSYEEEVKDELTSKPYLSSRQVYDHLRERHSDFPAVSEKTVFNFVTRVRDRYGIAKAFEESFRPCEKLPETDPGAYMQADLLAIDDIMLFPVKKEESASFFNLINSLHEKTSVIITTNKAPTEWVQTLNDEVLATAIIDRLLYHCEVIKLAGTSYRLENRKTIFHDDTPTQDNVKKRTTKTL